MNLGDESRAYVAHARQRKAEQLAEDVAELVHKLIEGRVAEFHAAAPNVVDDVILLRRGMWLVSRDDP